MPPTFENLKDALPPVFRKGITFFERLWDGDDTRELTVKTVTGNTVQPVTTAAADYQVLTTDCVVLLDGAAATVTATLPAAASVSGRTYFIKSINADNATAVAPTGAEEIDGSNSNIALFSMEALTLYSDGTGWWIL